MHHLVLCGSGSAADQETSPPHSTPQVQFSEQQGVLLPASEEGKSFLICLQL